MIVFSFGASQKTGELRDALWRGCKALAREGLVVVVDEVWAGRYTFFGCNVLEGEFSFPKYERVKAFLRSYAAEILAGLLLESEATEIARLVAREHPYLSPAQQNLISGRVAAELKDDNGVFPVAVRRAMLIDEIAGFLKESFHLILEGFARFRMRAYRSRLCEVIDRCVDEYLAGLAFFDLLQMLRHFVCKRAVRVEEVHVAVSETGKFKIIVCALPAVCREHKETAAMSDRSVSAPWAEIEPGNLLVRLLTLAPHRVTLHGQRIREDCWLIDLIASIFDKGTFRCPGCDLCRELR